MPRNAEVIRQWTILREIERTRGLGATIDDLASLCGVTTRTIRRDLQALEEAGFPLYDDRPTTTAASRWRINGQAMKGLAAGLTLAELCALHFSRTLVGALAGTPFREDVESAFEKLGSALTPHMRQFLDQLPRVIATKPDPLRARADPARRCEGARSDAEPAASHDRLSLEVERADQDVSGAPLSAGVRAGRTLSARLCPGVRRGPHVRRRANPGHLVAGGAFHTHRGTARHRISSLAWSPLRAARARRDRFSAGSRRLRQRPAVASVPARRADARTAACGSPSTCASIARSMGGS